MTKKKKEESTKDELFDDLWILLLLELLFMGPKKPEKVINIYMGDD